jgi:cyanophycin synthetase
VITLRGDPEVELLSRPLPAGLGALAPFAHLPGTAELVELITEARRGLAKRADGWALALAVVERVQLDHTLVPGRGRMLWVEGDQAKLLLPTDHLKVAVAALSLGGSIVVSMHAARAPRAVQLILQQRQKLNQTLFSLSPDMSTLAIARRAIENDIPVYFPSPSSNLIQLGQGRYGRMAQETVVDPQSAHALRLARDKSLTISRMSTLGLPTLPSRLVDNADHAVEVAQELGPPVVIKPSSGGKGNGISLNLTEEADIRRAFAIAARYPGKVLMEKFAIGEDHRMTVVEGKMLAAAKRVAATVTGDGKRTVRQLLDELNSDPRRGLPFEKLMERVQVDERLEALLVQQSLSLDAVPAKGQVVKATLAANVSQGGTAIDVTDIVHPDNRAAVEIATRSCHALVAGVDFFTPDISKSWRSGIGWILEVNTSPGLRPHWIANPEHDLVTPIVRVAFPEGTPSRVPTAAVTGSLGKTTTCQMLAHIARGAGRHPALNTTQGTWSGDVLLRIGDSASGIFTADLLTDPAVDLAISEMARGGLLKRGMILDSVDVAAVLNLSDNHVGMDEIESRDDLARIKAIPVRRAREWVFLYADDPLVLGMREVMAPGVRLGLVSPDRKSPVLAEHRAAGGCTVTLEGAKAKARVVVREGEKALLDLPLSSIPAGEHLPPAAVATNAMFAAGIALKLGLTAEEIAAGLAGFTSNLQQNPGRHNHIAGLPFDVLLTWADGSPALRELVAQLDQEPRPKARRHLYLTVPGNRSDEWTVEMGRTAAGHFDHYWCADMSERRGRAEGEMAALMAQGLREGGVAEDAITCLSGDQREVGNMLGQVEPGAHATLIIYETALGIRELELFRRSLQSV